MRTFALAAIGALALTGAAAAETRALSGFNGVAAADPIRVEIATGSAYAVEVTGGDAARVATEVVGDTLRIFQRNRPWFGGGRRLDASVRITMPEIDAISAARGASVRASDVRATDISLAAAMGADIRISGACRSVAISASMGGTIDAGRLACERGRASAAMGGDVQVNVSQALTASASMGGSVDVAGSPSQREANSSMGGSISFN